MNKNELPALASRPALYQTIVTLFPSPDADYIQLERAEAQLAAFAIMLVGELNECPVEKMTALLAMHRECMGLLGRVMDWQINAERRVAA